MLVDFNESSESPTYVDREKSFMLKVSEKSSVTHARLMRPDCELGVGGGGP